MPKDQPPHTAGAQPQAHCLLNVNLFERNGGADRDRTDDILLAKQALSQLSYSPFSSSIAEVEDEVVGLGRFELPTSPLSGVRSNQLSYRPETAASSC